MMTLVGNGRRFMGQSTKESTTPYLYRVDFYVNDKVVGSVETRAWTRFEAWVESWSTIEYENAKSYGRIMFDATRLERQDEI